ncbi:MAG: response regulator [Clostridia bacterium]|nr:response regulator [Clostridia bacterium]
MRVLRLVIADSDSRSRKKIRDIVQKQGCIVVGEAKDGLAALTQIRSTQPDLVILDAQLPIMDGMEVAKIIEENRISPVILISAYSQIDIIEKIKDSWVFAYLIKPVSEGNLVAAMELAMAKYEKVIELEQQIDRLKETLATRKLVDKAKGLLMKKLGFSEAEAFRYIQQQSMKKRVTKKAIAEAIILSHDLQD